MATQRENVQINLKIQGIEEFKSYKELASQVIAQRNAVFKMDKSDLGYKEAAERLQYLLTLQGEWRQQLVGAKKELQEVKSAWSEIGVIAGGVSIGNLISDGFSRVGDWVSNSLKKIKDGFAEAEKYRAILTNALEGDTKKAGKSLEMLMNFSAKTPMGMDEAIEGFIKLVNRGILPTQAELIKLGDLAASQGKSLDQLIEALLDAQTGEFERLKEFGIRASKDGAAVTFTFKGMTKEVKNTEEAIKSALLSFGEMNGVAGMMSEVAKGIAGIDSNIEDTQDQIFTKLGQRSEGVIYSFYKAYSAVLSYINEDLLATESVGQRLTKQFAEQAQEVGQLERNVIPLLDRYDALNMISVKNADEQSELEKIITDVANTLPGAVTAWDEYGNAIGINTTKAREFIDTQRAMLKVQNKSTVDRLQQEIKEYIKTRDWLLKQLNSGTMYESASPGTGGVSTVIRKMTTEEFNKVRASITKYNDLIKLNSDAIRGFNGDYLDDLMEKKTQQESKSAGRTEASIEKEIKSLRALRSELDIHSSAYAKYTKKIQALEEELNSASGKKSQGQKRAESAAEKAKKLGEELNKEAMELSVERSNNLLAESEREVAIAEQKYQKLIEKEKEFLKTKGLTAAQVKEHEGNVLRLESEKTEAAAAIRRKVEEKLLLDIKQLRSSLSKDLATELEKERETINQFYDQQEKANVGNHENLELLRKARAQDIASAELREAKRLQEEKQRIEQSGLAMLDDTHANRLLKINNQYDLEIEALRKKFSAEVQLTQQFQDTVASINANRTRAIQAEEQKSTREKIDYGIQGAEILNNTVTSIAANNRRRETDIALRNLDIQREKELANKNLTEEQKKQINDRFDERVRAEKLRAWRADQNAAAKQALISGLLGAAKAMPNFILAALAMGTGIANAAAIRAEKPPVFKRGGMIPTGPSHEHGGISLIDNSTGQEIGEMEGGEPIMILSKETARNNNRLINELLYNSQYRNGARVMVDSEQASQVMRPYATGGIVATPTADRGTPQVMPTGSTKALEDKIDQLGELLVETWKTGIPFNHRYYVEQTEKINKLKSRVEG